MIQPLINGMASIVPLGRGSFPRDSRHFVPGYYRAVPPGRKPSARPSASHYPSPYALNPGLNGAKLRADSGGFSPKTPTGLAKSSIGFQPVSSRSLDIRTLLLPSNNPDRLEDVACCQHERQAGSLCYIAPPLRPSGGLELSILLILAPFIPGTIPGTTAQPSGPGPSCPFYRVARSTL